MSALRMGRPPSFESQRHGIHIDRSKCLLQHRALVLALVRDLPFPPPLLLLLLLLLPLPLATPAAAASSCCLIL
jgi:hypothetical protein